MPDTSVYTCRHCTYSADVTGGATCDHDTVRVTITCRACRALHDVRPDQSPQTFLDNGCVSTSLTGLSCPVDPSHQFLLWHEGDPCPRCGGDMRVTRSRQMED